LLNIFFYIFGYSNLNRVCIGRNLAISPRILVEFRLLKISPEKHLILIAVFFIFNIKYFKILAIESQPKKNGRLGTSSAILWWTKSWAKDRW